jgi:hypothetical protein
MSSGDFLVAILSPLAALAVGLLLGFEQTLVAV